MAKLLITHNAEVDVRDNLDNTPLHVAARYGEYLNKISICYYSYDSQFQLLTY